MVKPLTKYELAAGNMCSDLAMRMLGLELDLKAVEVSLEVMVVDLGLEPPSKYPLYQQLPHLPQIKRTGRSKPSLSILYS